VDYIAGDRQGTSLLSIDSGSAQTVNRRYYDPYGNPIGTPPGAWPGTKGFVGGTNDPATTLTNLGAREYNPATGSFLSPDPLLLPYNPQDLNPYAYSADNPSTNSDPSGELFCGFSCGGWNGYPGSHVSTNPTPAPTYPTPAINYAGNPAYYGPIGVIRAAAPPSPKPVVRNKTNGSPATQATCASNALHTGLLMNCGTPALT
jgi:RHS repeat-associated protein